MKNINYLFSSWCNTVTNQSINHVYLQNIQNFVFVIASFQKYNWQFSLLINVTNSFNEPFVKNCIKIG